MQLCLSWFFTMAQKSSLSDPSTEEGFLLECHRETVLNAKGDFRYVFEYDDDNKKGKHKNASSLFVAF